MQDVCCEHFHSASVIRLYNLKRILICHKQKLKLSRTRLQIIIRVLIMLFKTCYVLRHTPCTVALIGQTHIWCQPEWVSMSRAKIATIFPPGLTTVCLIWEGEYRDRDTILDSSVNQFISRILWRQMGPDNRYQFLFCDTMSSWFPLVSKIWFHKALSQTTMKPWI